MTAALINIVLGIGIVTFTAWLATIVWLVLRIKRLRAEELTSEGFEPEYDRREFWP